MADIAFPQHQIKAYGRNTGVMKFDFVTAGAGAPTVILGDVEQITSISAPAGSAYTITFSKRFTRATVMAQLSGGVVGDAVDVTTRTFGTGAPCVLVLTTHHDNVAADLTGPVIQVTMLVSP
jgi:3-dehydroquinate synthetase